MSVLCVFNRTRNSFLGLRVTRATTVFARWPNVTRLPRQDGILLAPSAAIHTIGRASAIDVIYLDSMNRIVHLVEHLKPFPPLALVHRCHSVLELPPRTIFGSHTEIGDQLVICDPEELEESVARGALAA